MRRLFPGSLAGWGLLVVIVALTVAEVTTLLAIAQSRTASTLTKGLFQLADGSWLDFINTIAPPSNLWSAETIALTLGGILMVLVASTWALRQLTGPYSVLATAAERFGVDLDSPPLPETGPGEVRSAARAFNLMRDRLKRMVEDRDQMVAAVSHDIRTPVTRLRLRAEAIADPALRHPILADLHEIETMTQSVLALASDHAQPEPRQLVDLVSLVESLCADAPNVVLQLGGGLPPRIPIWAQPVEVRRCIGNVIANAVKYGRRAIVSLELAGGVARVIVDDEGPGIAPQELERIFRPFVRLESSRNRDTGGAGLGLTIARSVARSHGGDVTLGNRAGGGLRAIITLPRADEQRRAPGAGNVPMDARATARRGFIDADA
jgi:signal transduction histidine kinase